MDLAEFASAETLHYPNLLKEVLTNGNTVPVISNLGENVATLELNNVISCWPMYNPILKNAGRKLNYKFMYAEAVWILEGSDMAEGIVPYCKNISKYLDDDQEHFFGAYGPKVLGQMKYVVDALTEDPHSRRAVLTIWRESPKKSRDIPCTIMMHFMIREDRLNTTVYMRSSDAWWGVPYDVFNFSCISAFLLLLLPYGRDIQLGRLLIHHGSLHLYSNFIEKAIALTKGPHYINEVTGFIHDEHECAGEFVDLLRKRRDGIHTAQQTYSIVNGWN